MTTRADSSRSQLAHARLLWILTPPAAIEAHDSAESRAWLQRVAPAFREVDAVQVRPKGRPMALPAGRAASGVTDARAALGWTRAVLAIVRELDPTCRPLVFVNDRVDVACALADEGVDGVHLGDGDAPPSVARDLLGPDPLIGLSTHGPRDVVRALDEPVNLLGFGPVFATATKGYDGRSGPALLGPETAWVAATSSPLPLFPIGGIDAANIDELERVGRAAVASAISNASDPAAAARALRDSLIPE